MTVIVRGAPYRPVVRNLPRLTYLGPPIAIDTDAARAAMIVERIRTRCPELNRADLLLVARVLADAQRVKTNAPRPRPARAAKSRTRSSAPAK
jgi:hypothetical protein